ncbi:MAG: LysR family transcriptional regulator [Gammaproteobacteria bacterium]|nr:LysR family transcriptional regulator [Gammaproteobacteria bacterium]
MLMRCPIEIRHLRALTALSETGSLTRAADQLALTQSALSQQFRQIEEHYGVVLFERKTQPLRFTAAGERMLNLARDMLPRLDGADRDLTRIASGATGQLRIALECHSCFDWLMPAMDALRAEWPEVEQDLLSGFTPDPVALLLSGDADVAVHTEPDHRAGIAYHALFDFELTGCLSPRHGLAGRRFLTPEDFAAETFVHYPVDDIQLDGVQKFLLPAAVTPAARRTAELTVAIVQLVASGRGLAMLPSWTIQQYVERGYIKAMPLGKNGLWCRLYAATLEDAPAWVTHFRHLVRESAPKALPGIRHC